MRWVFVLIVSSFALTGCAKYEFDLVEPQELARHIGSDKDEIAVVERQPIEYRMRSVEVCWFSLNWRTSAGALRTRVIG